MSADPTRYAKLQSKCDKQAAEIKRLTRELAAVRDDLSDIKEQRDRLAALKERKI